MANQLDLSNVKWPEVMDLRTASIFLDLSEMRVRTLAREGGLPASKDDEGSWAFKKSDLTTYKNTPHARKGGGGGPRGDGKGWVIKVKFEDLEKVKAALAPFKIELQPRYNAEKMKASMARSKAKKLAAKAEAAKTGVKPVAPVPTAIKK
jgi:hypothetical protein